MMYVERRSMLVGLMVLLFFSFAGTGFSQPGQAPKEAGHNGQMSHDELMDQNEPEGHMADAPPCQPLGLPVDVIHSGNGFAILGNESHTLRLNVEALQPLEPMYIRKLLASNKSLAEIRDEIEANEGETIYRGSIRLDREIYPLVNLRLETPSENTTTLAADVASPGMSPDNETRIVGAIDMTIAPSEGGLIGKGDLELNGKGRYNVLLDMQPRMRERCKDNIENVSVRS
ncbi:MAG: hypothetical protein A4E48_00339 [Methanosaeta sp. PtaU1.Bin060]|nr:MAG: hypothetical protein A4E48_00339 [Methanosaeta sp. PtaU1.Bin060]